MIATRRGNILQYQRRDAEAIRYFRQAVELDSTSSSARGPSPRLSQHRRAHSARRIVPPERGTTGSAGGSRAGFSTKLGDTASARQQLARSSGRWPARVRLRRRDRGRLRRPRRLGPALEMLEKAADERAFTLVFLANYPMFESLHGPRASSDSSTDWGGAAALTLVAFVDRMHSQPRLARPTLASRMATKPLGIGFIGSGFNAGSTCGLQGIRDADVLGVWSPNRKNAASAAELRAQRSTSATRRRTRRSPTWSPTRRSTRSGSCGPNQARIENVEEIVDAIERGQGHAQGIACEKPLARNVAEAKRVVRAREARRPAARLPREPGLRAAGRARDASSSGRAAPRRRVGRISRARRRSTAARTCRGSGAASCRAAACSTT